eukprot:1156470-Pelagomonas_calceolata.AAC.6
MQGNIWSEWCRGGPSLVPQQQRWKGAGAAGHACLCGWQPGPAQLLEPERCKRIHAVHVMQYITNAALFKDRRSRPHACICGWQPGPAQLLEPERCKRIHAVHVMQYITNAVLILGQEQWAMPCCLSRNGQERWAMRAFAGGNLACPAT